MKELHETNFRICSLECVRRLDAVSGNVHWLLEFYSLADSWFAIAKNLHTFAPMYGSPSSPALFRPMIWNGGEERVSLLWTPTFNSQHLSNQSMEKLTHPHTSKRYRLADVPRKYTAPWHRWSFRRRQSAQAQRRHGQCPNCKLWCRYVTALAYSMQPHACQLKDSTNKNRSLSKCHFCVSHRKNVTK